MPARSLFTPQVAHSRDVASIVSLARRLAWAVPRGIRDPTASVRLCAAKSLKKAAWLCTAVRAFRGQKLLSV